MTIIASVTHQKPKEVNLTRRQNDTGSESTGSRPTFSEIAFKAGWKKLNTENVRLEIWMLTNVPEAWGTCL